MSNELTIKTAITIHAPASKVWGLLVNPEQTKKYMYGCETVSDWKEGSSLLWKGVFDGQELVAVSGNIVRLVPERQLWYTVFDPNGTYEDIPENYLTVTYDLEEVDGQTTLAVSQGDYSKVANGEQRFADSGGADGWQALLVKIKELAEA